MSANGLSSSKLILKKKGDLWLKINKLLEESILLLEQKLKEALFRILDKISGGGIDQGF